MEFFLRSFNTSPAMALKRSHLKATLFCTVLFAALLLPLTSFSEELLPRDFPLPVESVKRVTEDQVEVRLSNASRVIKRELLFDYIAEKYLSFRTLESRYSPEKLESYLLANMDLLEQNQYSALLAILLRHTRYEAKNFAELLEGLLIRSDGELVLRDAMKHFDGSPPKRAEVFECLLQIGLSDREWLRENLLSTVLAVKDPFRNFLLERYRTFAGAGDFQQATSLVELSSYLFGTRNEEAKSLLALDTRLSRELESLNDQKDDDLGPFLEKLRKDPTVGALLGDFLLNRVHEEAERALSSAKPNLAIELLAQVSEEERTPTTLRLLKAGVKALPTSELQLDNPAVLSSGLRNTIEELSSSNYVVRENYLQYLELLFRAYLVQGNEELFTKFFHYITEVRPDSSSENDDLRLEMAVWFSEQGRKSRARKLLDERRSALSPFDYILLLRAGYFPNRVLMSLIAVLVLAFFLFVRLVWPTREPEFDDLDTVGDDQGSRADPLESEDFSDPQEKVDERPQFNLLYKSRGLDPKLHEYRLMLNRLGLGPEADLRMIKAAYRSKLKELHPDLQAEGQGDSEEFHRVKDTYEKIVELRQQLGFDSV